MPSRQNQYVLRVFDDFVPDAVNQCYSKHSSDDSPKEYADGQEQIYPWHMKKKKIFQRKKLHSVL